MRVATRRQSEEVWTRPVNGNLVAEEEPSPRLRLELESAETTWAWRWALRWHTFKRFLDTISQLEETRGQEPRGVGPPASAETPSRERGSGGPSIVLFISHDAKRHGAQIPLLHFLRWFKANTEIPFEILLKGDGELRSEFEALAPVTLWNEKAFLRSAVRRLRLGPFVKDMVRRLGLAPLKNKLMARRRHRAISANGEKLRSRFGNSQVDLVYSNTATNGKVLEALSSLSCPVICHVHELDYCLNFETEQDNNGQVTRHAHHFIAASKAVKEGLVRNLGIPEKEIDIVHEFIPTDTDVDSDEPSAIRRRLGIPDIALVVGASGTTDWRKGPDLFIQLAQSVIRRNPQAPVHFVWVGGEREGPVYEALWHDVVHAGLETRVHFTGHVANPLEHFAFFDVFVLTSREDPFPLVNLEAATLAKPIVCFDGAGGAKEFVEDDCGFVVPYLNIEAMADRVDELLESPELRRVLGVQAAVKVRERHDVHRLAPKVHSLIERFLRNGTRVAVRGT